MSTIWLKRLPPALRLPGTGVVTKTAPAKKKAKAKAKYNNTKIENRFGKFDSRHEWERFQKLWLLQRKGLISDLRRQVKFVLAPGVKFSGEKRAKPALRYFADFVYLDHLGNEVIEDAKSKATRNTKSYRQKKHLMKSVLQKEIVEV